MYTSPSHKPDRPRWRILAPLSKPYPPGERGKFLGWLHGLYSLETSDGTDDVFANESWTLSQSFFYGAIGGGTHHRVVIVHGKTIDQLDELAAIARGRHGGSANVRDGTGDGKEEREDAELIRAIVTAEHFHVELCALAARYIGRGMDQRSVSQILRGLMFVQPEKAGMSAGRIVINRSMPSSPRPQPSLPRKPRAGGQSQP